MVGGGNAWKVGRKLALGFAVLILALGQAGWADPLEEFAALEEQMEKASEAYVESLDGKAPESAEASARKADARPGILKKMDELAEKHAGQPDGAYLAAQAFLWSLDIEPKEALGRFEHLTGRYPNEAELDEPLEFAMDSHDASGKAEDWAKVFTKLAATTTRKETKVGATFATGVMRMGSGKSSEAKEAFEAALKLDADSDYSDSAKLFIHEIDHLRIGMKAPDFTTKDLAGKDVSLASFKGKVVLLDIWATWCPPCIAEMPHLKKAAEKFADKPFQIVSVSVDEEKDAVEGLVKSLSAPGIHTWDPAGSENPVANLYAAQKYPTWYLIDGDGVIRARDPFGEKLIPAIEAALKPAKAAASEAPASAAKSE